MKDYNIKVLTGIEAVRKRPGMYIGDTSTRGLHQLIYEILKESINETIIGCCNCINIILTKEGSVIIEDNGRGILIEEKYKVAKSLEYGDRYSYHLARKVHNKGFFLVNALSKEFQVIFKHNSNVYRQSFKKGMPIEDLVITGKTSQTGTRIEFLADDTIFTESTVFQKEIVEERCKELAYLNPKITINFSDERDDYREIFHFKNGIKDLLRDINKKNIISSMQVFQGKADDIDINIAFLYCDDESENIVSFVDGIKTINGGTHEAGFISGLSYSILKYAQNMNIDRRNLHPKKGVVAIVSIYLPEPQFERYNKEKLYSGYVRPLIAKFVRDRFAQYIKENPIEAELIIDHISST